MKNKPLMFHWSLSQAGNKSRRSGDMKKLSGIPPYEAQLALCRRAEACGIDSMLMAIGFTRPDPLMLTISLGLETSKIKFMVACRPGLIEPAVYVRQINTASQIIGERIHLNIVCGHSAKELAYYGDFLEHDQRYRRSGEFLEVCKTLWSGEVSRPFSGDYYKMDEACVGFPFPSPQLRPAIYMGGNSQEARNLVIAHGDCLWRFPDTPQATRAEIGPILAAGKRAGLLVSLIARPTREEAHQAAIDLIQPFGEEARQVHRAFAGRSDSVGFTSMYKRAGEADAWITDTLWTGAVPYLGPPSIALVGSYDDIAGAIMSYKAAGISEYLFMGWPEIDEMTLFGTEVLPRIREMEKVEARAERGPQ